LQTSGASVLYFGTTTQMKTSAAALQRSSRADRARNDGIVTGGSLQMIGDGGDERWQSKVARGSSVDDMEPGPGSKCSAENNTNMQTLTLTPMLGRLYAHVQARNDDLPPAQMRNNTNQFIRLRMPTITTRTSMSQNTWLKTVVVMCVRLANTELHTCTVISRIRCMSTQPAKAWVW